jgi:hypothetical protein
VRVGWGQTWLLGLGVQMLALSQPAGSCPAAFKVSTRLMQNSTLPAEEFQEESMSSWHRIASVHPGTMTAAAWSCTAVLMGFP